MSHREFLLEQLRQRKQLAAELPASAPHLRKWATNFDRTDGGPFDPVVAYGVRVFEIDRRFKDEDVYQPWEGDLASQVVHPTETAEETLEAVRTADG